MNVAQEKPRMNMAGGRQDIDKHATQRKEIIQS